MATLASKTAEGGQSGRQLVGALAVIPIAIGFLFGWLQPESLETLPKLAALAGGILMALIGWFSAHLGTHFVARSLQRFDPHPAMVLALGVVVSAPLAIPGTFAVHELFAWGGLSDRRFSDIFAYSWRDAIDAVLVPIALWTGVNMLLIQHGIERFGLGQNKPVTQQTNYSVGTVKDLLARLRPAFRGDILALKAEQHYVRVYTSRGEDLIHLRFSDAVALAASVPGVQVHRSWWVAHSAVESIVDGAQLHLKFGIAVPIGRTFARDVRHAGLSN